MDLRYDYECTRGTKLQHVVAINMVDLSSESDKSLGPKAPPQHVTAVDMFPAVKTRLHLQQSWRLLTC